MPELYVAKVVIQGDQWVLIQWHSLPPVQLLWTCGTNDHGVPVGSVYSMSAVTCDFTGSLVDGYDHQ